MEISYNSIRTTDTLSKANTNAEHHITNISSTDMKFINLFKSAKKKENSAQPQVNCTEEHAPDTRPRYTPPYISSLKEDEVFVFGSNLGGFHGGGAARTAHRYFGAIWGQGTGLQGQSYVIPTMQGGVDTIKPYVDEFIAFARDNKQLFFYVTPIGCGIAGFSEKDIAPLFREALDVENICLPKSFCDILFWEGRQEEIRGDRRR